MERKADMTDFSFCPLFFQKVHQMKLLRPFPYWYGYIMDQVHINDIHLQPRELFVKYTAHGLLIFCQPYGHFIREKNFFAISVL
mgnify:CR=1 FL=1